MDIRITGAPAGGTVRAIPSKSAAHRILIAAALSGIDLTGSCDGLSRDITATKECLQEMMRSRKTEDAAIHLDCGESGSTLRFLIPLAGVLGIDADFQCEGRLPDRPMGPFLDQLAEHGCVVSGRNPKKLRGTLAGGDFRLPGNISSQYVTGLLMALPLAEEDSRIIVEGTLQSRPYIDLTLQVLEKAGIRIEETRRKVSSSSDATKANECDATIFHVCGRQSYHLPEDALEHIEGDWSNAAFWLVMDAMLRGLAMGPETLIRCEGLDPSSAQGDRAIVQVIERVESADEMLFRRDIASGPDRLRPAFGIDISVEGRCGYVEIDVSDIPDLVPIIAAFACGRPAGAVTHITNAQRLRFKESDRLKAVTEVLAGLGADITEEEAGLAIRGTGTLSGGMADSFGDHRIVMMAAACACIAKEDIIISGAESVNKSYPAFFEDYRMLGGSWEVIG